MIRGRGVSSSSSAKGMGRTVAWTREAVARSERMVVGRTMVVGVAECSSEGLKGWLSASSEKSTLLISYARGCKLFGIHAKMRITHLNVSKEVRHLEGYRGEARRG